MPSALVDVPELVDGTHPVAHGPCYDSHMEDEMATEDHIRDARSREEALGDTCGVKRSATEVEPAHAKQVVQLRPGIGGEVVGESEVQNWSQTHQAKGREEYGAALVQVRVLETVEDADDDGGDGESGDDGEVHDLHHPRTVEQVVHHREIRAPDEDHNPHVIRLCPR
eukprot:CAMPEP_0167784528 /NCGR_PEP_ID=MMETSP0111_2-20121227/7686_1 /TAXON_ID=91324 /ORGANISM="Lotharella globosa, Strain CCCM811" /LENGTH=167 /DNA_ID=CAMNT_0007675607 /DNA_START=245 /DNA_END=748 /DNA_ORIENTATION=+